MMVGLAAFLVALVLATLVEYWGHRLMHTTRFLRRKHANHHKMGRGQGWLLEFRDYGLPSVLGALLGFLVSVPVGAGLVAGAVVYAAVAAYAHQLQHERPHQVFWLKQPVHSVHHVHQEWDWNFGIVTDVWDRVFGTYREHPPLPRVDDDRGMLDIHWVTAAPPLTLRPGDGERAAPPSSAG